MVNEEIGKFLKEIGTKGGNSTKKKYGPGYYKKISMLGVQARKKNHEKIK